MNNCLLFIVALPKVKFAKEVLQPSSTIYIALFFNPKYVLLKTEYVDRKYLWTLLLPIRVACIGFI